MCLRASGEATRRTEVVKITACVFWREDRHVPRRGHRRCCRGCDPGDRGVSVSILVLCLPIAKLGSTRCNVFVEESYPTPHIHEQKTTSNYI